MLTWMVFPLLFLFCATEVIEEEGSAQSVVTEGILQATTQDIPYVSTTLPTTAAILKKTTTVPVVPTAPVLYVPRGRTGVCRGNTAKIKCDADGLPRPDILWKHDYLNITEGPKYKIEKLFEGIHVIHSALHIRAVSSKDYGFYECAAVNGMGYKQATLALYQPDECACRPC